MITERERPWPEGDLSLSDAVADYFRFLHDTAVNKVAGLGEQQARMTPIPTSPAVSPLGLIQHLTAVYRQHLQIHLVGTDLPSLWTKDTTSDFRIAPEATVESVIAAFDAEFARASAAVAAADLDATVQVYGRPVRVGRLLVDVQQEIARHVGQLDIVRELIDGATGE